MNSPSEQEGVLRSYAEMLGSHVDLDDFGDVLLEFTIKRQSVTEIRDLIPAIVVIAKKMRESRNQITDIAETARGFS